MNAVADTAPEPISLVRKVPGFRSQSFTSGGGDSAAWTMVSLGLYGAFVANASTSAGVAVERAQGWSRQLRLTPLRGPAYTMIKVIVSSTVALAPLVVLYVLGLFFEARAHAHPGAGVRDQLVRFDADGGVRSSRGISDALGERDAADGDRAHVPRLRRRRVHSAARLHSRLRPVRPLDADMRSHRARSRRFHRMVRFVDVVAQHRGLGAHPRRGSGVLSPPRYGAGLRS